MNSKMLIMVGHESQYAWPPQDPTRLTQPGPEYYQASGSAFVYGNESFNPALKPTNSLRSRHPPQEGEGEVYSSGSERDDEDVSESSSPEPYMSDYDHGNSGPLGQGERMPRYNQVRQGSEGYEVRPMGSWNIVDHPPDSEPGVMRTGNGREMPWEERGRYNVYEPASAEDDEEDDDWDEQDEGEDVPLAILRNRMGHAQ
jgi:palmitoyltransferase